DEQACGQAVVERLVASHGGMDGLVGDIAEMTPVTQRVPRMGAGADPGVVVNGGREDMWAKLARCCTPVPGDAVFGFITRSGGISVHRDDCSNAIDLKADPDRIVEVDWNPTAEAVFVVGIQVEALDRQSLLVDVMRVLSEGGVRVLSATMITARGHVVCRFSFEMGDPKTLRHLLAAAGRIDGVFDV